MLNENQGMPLSQHRAEWWNRINQLPISESSRREEIDYMYERLPVLARYQFRRL